MNELLSKISSYNIFNYLLPGVVFASVASSLTRYSFIQSDLLVGAFVYYFLGLIISRIGSILVEPILKKIGFVKFTSYEDYISATKKDELIVSLSESNNMYRTFVSLSLSLLILKGYELMSSKFSFLEELEIGVLVLGLFVLFLLSYQKQTTYISKRIQHNLSKE